jgi:hypothetical protein
MRRLLIAAAVAAFTVAAGMTLILVTASVLGGSPSDAFKNLSLPGIILGAIGIGAALLFGALKLVEADAPYPGGPALRAAYQFLPLTACLTMVCLVLALVTAEAGVRDLIGPFLVSGVGLLVASSGMGALLSRDGKRKQAEEAQRQEAAAAEKARREREAKASMEEQQRVQAERAEAYRVQEEERRRNELVLASHKEQETERQLESLLAQARQTGMTVKFKREINGTVVEATYDPREEERLNREKEERVQLAEQRERDRDNW